MRKKIAVLVILTLTVSCLSNTIIEDSHSAITAPNMPEFTLKIVHHSVDQAAISSVDPYTGENKTVVPAKHDEWNSIVVTIKNQPFTPYTDSKGNEINLYYNVRSKGHFSQDWTELANINDGYPTPNQIPPLTNKDYMELDYFANYSADAQVDFQVEVMIGYFHEIKGPLGVYDQYQTVFTGETSGWSDIQTITISDNSTTVSPTSSSLPSTTIMYNQPVSGDLATASLGLIGIAIAVLFAFIVVLLLVFVVVYLRRRTSVATSR